MNEQEVYDWVADIPILSKDNLRQYTSYRHEEPQDDSVWYGDMRSLNSYKTEGDIYLDMPYCSYSDYSGGTVEMANHKVLTDEESKDEFNLPPMLESYGGYNTRAIFFNLSKATEEQLEELNELLMSLSNYPLISDDVLSEMEWEMTKEDLEDLMFEGVMWILEKEERQNILDWIEANDGSQIMFKVFFENDLCSEIEGTTSVLYFVNGGGTGHLGEDKFTDLVVEYVEKEIAKEEQRKKYQGMEQLPGFKEVNDE